MANVGVTFDFAAESAKLRSEIDKVRKELGTLNATTKSIKDGFSTMGNALAGALSVGAITGFLVKVNGIADGLNDLAQRTGASASGLQALQVAAAQAGGSAEALNTAVGKMSSTIGDAMVGSKAAVAAFDQLGLSAKDLAGLKTDEAFRLINQRLSEIPNTFERAAAAQNIFGKGAKELAGLFVEGEAAVRSVEDALRDQGAALNDLDIAKIGVMNDELQFQSVVVTNLGTKFLGGLAPAVGVATGALSEMLGKLGGATTAGEGFGVILTAAIKSIEAAAYGLATVFETVRELIAGVLAVITGTVSDILSAFAYLSDVVGLDTMAAGLRRGQEVMGGISESLTDISKQASLNADVAGKAAIEAATNIVNAATIFAEAQARYEAKAAAAAARNAAAQGGGSGYQLPESLGGKAAADPLARGQQQALGALDTSTDALLKKFDPAVDFEAINADARNAYLQSQWEAHSQTMVGKLDAFNSTWLGQMLTANQTQIDAEAYKNLTIGDMMGTFANIAMQQGGKLGKIGKALAIAQTIWSTGTAVMNAMAQIPYPANIAAAAGAAAMGIAQLANITKTNVGSGGSVASAKGGGGGASSPALSNSVPGTQPSTESQQKSATQIIINGSLFAAQETVDWLVEKIGEAVNGRDMVFINGNSRQAMELVPG